MSIAGSRSVPHEPRCNEFRFVTVGAMDVALRAPSSSLAGFFLRQPAVNVSHSLASSVIPVYTFVPINLAASMRQDWSEAPPLSHLPRLSGVFSFCNPPLGGVFFLHPPPYGAGFTHPGWSRTGLYHWDGGAASDPHRPTTLGHLPQVAEAKIPRLMDAAGEENIYYGCSEICKDQLASTKGCEHDLLQTTLLTAGISNMPSETCFHRFRSPCQ